MIDQPEMWRVLLDAQLCYEGRDEDAALHHAKSLLRMFPDTEVHLYKTTGWTEIIL